MPSADYWEKRVRDLIARAQARGDIYSNRSASSDEPICYLCNGTGFQEIQPASRLQTSTVSPCECRQHQARIPDGVPAAFVEARLNNLLPHHGNLAAIAAIKAWLDGTLQDLFFTGAAGRGKSRAACSALNEICARGRPGLFVSVPFLILQQLRAFDDVTYKAPANRLLERCFAAENLVLDDIAGGEKGSDFTRGFMVTLYERRLSLGQRRTIWTSNLDLDQLADFYGDERLSSRLAERCRGGIIQIAGADFRAEPRRLRVVGGRGR